ncbi:MAG: hypothetical protein J5944_06000 [Lentisphaeria bacterium]|nr:hypothetical protein [Lentisphaeria bacterium]
MKDGYRPNVRTTPEDSAYTPDCTGKEQMTGTIENFSRSTKSNPPRKAKTGRRRESKFASGGKYGNEKPCSNHPVSSFGTIQRVYCISTSSGWKSSGLFSGKKNGSSGSSRFFIQDALFPLALFPTWVGNALLTYFTF